MSADGNLTVRDMEDILSEIKQKEIDRVVFKTEQLHRFFPVRFPYALIFLCEVHGIVTGYTVQILG